MPCNSRIQQNENKLKQREISLNQRQEDLGRRKMEIDQYQQRVDNEKKLLSVKQQELDKMQKQKQAKLEELFELRLIHGEVDEEEWGEYLEGFRLRSWKYFATAVVILNLGDEEIQSMVNEDAICLKLLSEMPDSLKERAWMPPIYNASAIFAIFAEEDEDILLEKILLHRNAGICFQHL